MLGVAETLAEDAVSIPALQTSSSSSSSTRAPYTRVQRMVPATSPSDPRVIDALRSDVYAGAVLEGRADVGGEGVEILYTLPELISAFWVVKMNGETGATAKDRRFVQ